MYYFLLKLPSILMIYFSSNFVITFRSISITWRNSYPW
jgi:hypothetical protein